MEMVTLSSKYQVVIPRSVRVSLGLKPGMKLQVIAYNGHVEFLAVRKAELRGLLRGLEPVIEREPSDCERRRKPRHCRGSFADSIIYATAERYNALDTRRAFSGFAKSEVFPETLTGTRRIRRQILVS
jgi:AbrB family looped-hinge helix DNA binding protein